MSGGETRFQKGQSGNPAGRPKARRPHISAFDIIFDKTLTVTLGDVQRELTVDEGLQLQTYQAALKGSKIAVRAVLKIIEKRAVVLAKKNPHPVEPVRIESEHDSDNADEAMLILGIAQYAPNRFELGPDKRQLKLATWAAQAGISRPGGRKLTDSDKAEIEHLVIEPELLSFRTPRK